MDNELAQSNTVREEMMISGKNCKIFPDKPAPEPTSENGKVLGLHFSVRK